MAYKGKHFEDRSLFQHYTATIVRRIFFNSFNISQKDCNCK